MTAAERRAAEKRGSTWTCRACGAQAVSTGAYPHGWVMVARRGAADGSRGPDGGYFCGWACARTLVAARAELAAAAAASEAAG